MVWGIDVIGMFIAIAMISLAMQVCSPAVAATQFTIYMALGNFGRPIGAAIVAATNAVDPQMMFYTIGGIMVVASLSPLALKRADPAPDVERLVAHGAGTGPAEN